MKQLCILMIFVFFSVPVLAHDGDEIPLCKQDREGSLACMANKACSCTYYPAGGGREARFAWDCGVLRQACEFPAVERQNFSEGIPSTILVPQPVLKPAPEVDGDGGMVRD